MMVGHVVIPIHNVKGELVAYAGRWPGKPPDADTPKYKIPAGFKKSQEVFNLDRAISEPADKPLVIVEGFFDVIKLHQNGWRKVVALMGSTMSAMQEELIRLHTDKSGHIIVMLDENTAGQAGRKDIAGRLSEHCLVKTHVFDTPDAEPEHLTAEDVQRLLGGAT
jgi:DNA primase